MGRGSRRRGDSGGSHPFRVLFILLLLVIGVWFTALYVRIDRVAQVEDASPSDAIAVFGAAQYVGRPSPVYHARLDHAAALYERKMAPVVVTLGGNSDKRTARSEGSVGRDYLLAQGIPFDHIIAETESLDTAQQAEKLADIARANGWRQVIVVSDGTHLFRIHALCEREGLRVLTSPRGTYGNLSPWGHFMRVAHEMMSYTFLRLHIEAGWAKRWMEGKEES